jgi:putative inorganic carbon (hco3(-)) transporter
MTREYAARHATSIGLSAMLGWTGAFVLVLLLNLDSPKVSYSLLAAVAGAGCAALTGNPRLLCVWAFTMTLTLDLSKHFGPLYLKMGGEGAFKAEASDVFLLILAFWQLHDIWQDRRVGIRVPKVTWVWVLLMIMGLFTVVFGHYRLTALHEVSRMVKVGVLFIVMTNELERPARLLHCVAALSFATVVQSIIAIIQYFTRKHLGLTILGEAHPGTLTQLADQTLSGERAFRASALMSHPNIFSVFLAVAIPLAIAGFLLPVRTAYKLLFFTASILGMAALILTLSRSGWVSFAIAFSVLLGVTFLHPRLQGRSLFLGGAAAAVLLIVCIVFAGPILTRIYDSKEGAMLSRAEYATTARNMIRLKPLFGWGLNSYVWAAPPFTKYGIKGTKERYKGWLPPVHNIYLLWASEMGYVGMAVHLLLWGWVIATAVSNIKVSNQVMYAINAACLSGLLALVFDGFLSFTWRINSIMRLYWLVAAMVMAVRYYRLREERGDERIGS